MKKGKDIKFYCALVFIFFLILGFLVPYTGDDWNNILYDGKISTMIKIAVDSYNSFEGRFFSRVFDLVFVYYKPIWVIVNACGMTFLYYFINKMVNSKKKSFFLVFILESLLLVDEETFSQVYVWITGNTTYFIPMIFLIFLIYINRNIFNDSDIKYNKIFYIIIPILSFINSMFVENVTVGIITVYILVIVYQYIKNKKINILMLISMFTSLIGLYLMLNSPGTLNRLNTMDAFNNMTLIEKIISTFPRQLNEVFVKNSYLTLILVFISIVLIKDNIKGIKKYILILFSSIIPVLTSFTNLYYVVFRRSPKYFGILLDCHKWYLCIYWVLFLILLVALVIKYSKVDKKKILFFFLIALINNGAMMLSPLCGGRTSYLSNIMLFICAFLIIDSLNLKILNNVKFLRFNKFVLGAIVTFFLIFYSFCYILFIRRANYIKEQLNNKEETIKLIQLPNRYLWNANPQMDLIITKDEFYNNWHLYTFELYYKIPVGSKVELVRSRDL